MFEKSCVGIALFGLLVAQFHRIAGYNCNSFATGHPVSSTTTTDYKDRIEEAKKLIRSAGARLTRPRVSVLPVLLAADRALRHQDIVDALFDTHAMERVTVYLNLEWMRAKLPAGDRSQTVELSIRGLCGDCSPEQASR